MRSFLRGEGQEAVVVESGGARGFCHGPEDGAGGQDVADTSAQFFFALILSVPIWSPVSAEVERSENSARLGEVRGGRIERNLAMLERRSNGIVRQAKQLGAFFAGEFLNGSY